MIPILLRLNWLTVKRDRAALVLLFVLPVVFFSIFALVFSGGGEGGVPAIDVASAAIQKLTREVRGWLRQRN